MWKILFTAVLANSFFLSLGIYMRGINECFYKRDESCNDLLINELKYGKEVGYIDWPKNVFEEEYESEEDDDSEEESEEEYESEQECDEDNQYEDEDESYDIEDDCREENEEYECEANGCDPIDCSNALAKFNAAVLDFSLKLFKTYVDSTPGETGVLCPVANLFLIGQLALFGKRETKVETYRILNLSNRAEIECVFGIINKAIEFQNLPKNVEFYGITDYYGNTQYPFTNNFKSNMTYIIVGVAKNVDFSKPEKAADIINNQVASASNNRVTDIIVDSCIFSRSTELVAIAGTYFSSPWEIKFEKSKTFTEFRVAPGKSMPTLFNHQTAVYDYAYSSDLCSKAIRINFKDKKFNLLLILPDEPFTENKVIDKMLANSVGWYTKLRKQLKPKIVEVYLPIYNEENYVNSRDLIIKSTNLRTIYSRKTIQLKGAIKGDKQAGVSVIRQKHNLQIPSEGGPVPKLPKEGETIRFVADYPHIFFICLTETETLFYPGIFRRPTTGQYCD